MYYSFFDLARQQVQLGQATIAPEDKGVAGIAGINCRSVRQVAQAFYLVQYGICLVLDHQDTARGSLYNNTHIPGAAQFSLGIKWRKQHSGQ